MSAPHRFDPGSVGTFRVTDRSFDTETRTLSLRYALDDSYRFVETITFESPADGGLDPRTPGFQRALLHLHVAAGVSYYKTAAPPAVSVEQARLHPDEQEFHHHLYDDGLREFAVTNRLPVPRPVVIGSTGEGSHPDPRTAAFPRRSGGLLVPIGGGKDSMVLIESLKHLQPTLFAVNPHPLVLDLAAQTGLDLLVVRRRLDPQLPELNRSGALNGHVPITAVISLIAVVGSFLYGYDTIGMAVERSASEETVSVGGTPVNHQYSKSIEFERLLQRLIVGSIDQGLTYGSPLRPYSELAISRTFARLGEYHGTFCSCNTVFRQGASATDRWCGHCPKCRFVGLMLAPFLGRAALTAIIGRDMFADVDQVDGFAALMSDRDKPFECVGERRESAAAMVLLAGLPQWQGAPVVAALADQASSLVSEADIRALLTPSDALRFSRPDVAESVDRLMTELP